MKLKEQGQAFVPLLIEVERELDQAISLQSLAARFGYSSFHFHRNFSDSVGETPKKHVQRLRLERAANLLAVTDDPILDVGLAVGFRNPETFSRNFRKFTGYSPSGYRRMAKAAQAERVERVDFHRGHDFRLSRARFETFPSTPLLAIRNMGGYGELNESFGDAEHLWSELARFGREANLPISPVFIGIFYDDPTMTPEPLQRADVCVPVDRVVDSTARIRCIEFEGGMYATAEYVGPVSSLLHAFQGLADEIRRSGSHTFRNGAAVEFLRTPNVNGEAGVHHIDVCFPVKKIDRRRKNRQEGMARES